MNTNDKFKTRQCYRSKTQFYDRNAWVGSAAHEGKGFYNKYGYFVIRGFFDSLTAEEAARNSFNDWKFVVNDPASGKIRSALWVHSDKNIKKEFLNDDRLLRLAANVVGEETYIHQSRINFKHSGSTGWSWHSDFETWHSQDGMPEMKAFTALIALDKNHSRNGPLTVLPGSHKWFWSAPKQRDPISAQNEFAEQTEGVLADSDIKYISSMCGCLPKKIFLNPGDLLIFDCNLLHTSSENHSGDRRSNLYFVFNAKSNALTKPFSSNKERPEYMGHRREL